MNIILLEQIPKLGYMGQIVRVRPGYARNYLLPQKKALRATKENLAYFEAHRGQLEMINLQQLQEATYFGKQIDGVQVIILRQGSERGTLYGSVMARDIVAAAHQAGFTIDRRQVIMERPIKTCGLFSIRLGLHPQVEVTLQVNVARSDAEAQAQYEQNETAKKQEAEKLQTTQTTKSETPEQKTTKQTKKQEVAKPQTTQTTESETPKQKTTKQHKPQQITKKAQ